MDASELRPLFLFEGITDAQLGEMAAVGDVVTFEEGHELFREGDPADCWWVLLEGQVSVVRRAGREATVVMMTMDRPGQWAGGFHAWDESSQYLATGRAVTPGRMFRLPSWELGRLAREWFPFAVHLIQGFFQTVRRMDAMSRDRERLIGLGQIAAGLGHELNNPASASARAVDALHDSFDTLLASLVAMGERSLTADRFVAIDSLRREIDPSVANTDPLAVADRENALSSWLDQRGVKDAWRITPGLAAAGVDVAWCERAGAILEGDTLGPGLTWVESTLSTQALLTEIKESTARISALIDDVRSYAQLDRAPMQAIDVTEGIESTLKMLRAKLGDGVVVVRDYAEDLPQIDAFPAELNQVWTNLIDNAIDAMERQGTLRITTRTDGDEVLVEVSDTGPGMPLETQAR
ncbi:MAG TPA: cyclic nucleotide-binding domain-containing protein, partial [Acidimicrobiales bacterium]|nr:cyclic nucleotide-binding domain-containing protein [Acidimicrobiales bacterium]